MEDTVELNVIKAVNHIKICPISIDSDAPGLYPGEERACRSWGYYMDDIRDGTDIRMGRVTNQLVCGSNPYRG